MSIERISHLVYKGTTTEAIQFVQDCKSEEELFIFVYNYNWENGLATPRLVMENPVCSMEIAQLLFFSGDGYTFLSEGLMNQESGDEWVLFMKHLYASIVARQYKAGKTAFKVPLTKVQIYKLKKQIDPEAFVLFTEFSGVDCNIIV